MFFKSEYFLPFNIDEGWDIYPINFFLSEWKMVTQNKTFNAMPIYSILNDYGDICIDLTIIISLNYPMSQLKNVMLINIMMDFNNELFMIWGIKY